ncbi:MAG: Asp-tRNA(Asn)/Glu-tRNA(Gln) amidotransferase subunit GatB [Spirochaetaceae bacterium]|nr:Asp-tRNA(Asn)/Glu-tRNA(Gln) amidotransferase subunit GatB [Spirochaetaceae bacterium]
MSNLFTDSTSGLQYKVVIGMESHVQVLSQSKAFCGCANSYGGIPNSRTCPSCLALPGALPRVNKRLFEAAIMLGQAFGCTINKQTGFARKSYSYPDLTKGYQITQTAPICTGGAIEIELDGGVKHIHLVGLHMEEDVGKTLKLEDSGEIYLDYNRCGAPLLEVVSQPEISNANEAVAYAMALRELVRYTGIGNGDMEEGSLRLDANINLHIHKDGQVYKTPIAEVKNMNSFKAIKQAINYEISRQLKEWQETGITMSHPNGIKTTRRYDDSSESTIFMRKKGILDDYRFCPEPDLKTTTLNAEWLKQLQAKVGELPLAKRRRLKASYGLSDFDVETLTAERELVNYYEEALNACANPKRLANWLLTELLGKLKTAGLTITSPQSIPPSGLAALVNLIEEGKVNGKQAKELFEVMFSTGKEPIILIKELNFTNVNDETVIKSFIAEVLAENPQAISDYAAGKSNALKFLMGMVMKKSKGQANPEEASRLLEAELRRE